MTEKLVFGIIFPLMFCLIGGGLFARSGYVHLREKRDKKRRCLLQTRGTITGISPMRVNKRLAYFPTYEYRVGDKVIRIDINLGTTSCPYKIGEEVKVWYDPNFPDFSYIEGYKEDIAAAIGSLVLGSITALGGLWVGYVAWFG